MGQTHSGTVLTKYRIDYWRCSNCEFWATEDPYWLKEAYGSAISVLDTGILQRNFAVADDLAALLPAVAPSGPYVDWAGGLGILTRMMRDRGFEFYWQDSYSQNEVARGFEWTDVNVHGVAEAVTAVEVLEHAPDPVAFLTEVLESTGAGHIIFTQELHGPDTSPDWWYFAPESGQHVSFFSTTTLHALADRLDMHLSRFRSLFLLSSTKPHLPVPNQPKSRFGRVRLRLSLLPPSQQPSSTARESLTWPDHELLKSKLLRTEDSGA